MIEHNNSQISKTEKAKIPLSQSIPLCFAIAMMVGVLSYKTSWGTFGKALSTIPFVFFENPSLFISSFLGILAACAFLSYNLDSDNPKLKRLDETLLVSLAVLAVLIVIGLAGVAFIARTPNEQDYSRLMRTSPDLWQASSKSGILAHNLQMYEYERQYLSKLACEKIAKWDINYKYYTFKINNNDPIAENCMQGLNTMEWSSIKE